MPKTFEQYLREGLRKDIIDFKIRAHLAQDGRVVFYIYPDSKNGDTEDYEVFENVLQHNRDCSIAKAPE